MLAGERIVKVFPLRHDEPPYPVGRIGLRPDAGPGPLIRPDVHAASVRRARIPFFRDVTRTLLEREVPGIAPEARDDIVDTVLLLVSSSAMFEMLDVLEVPIDRAARLVSSAVRALVDANRPAIP